VTKRAWKLLLAATLLHPAHAVAQELEPRAYSASPVGANFAGVSYLNSWGSLLFDPTVPITDAKANVNGIGLAYGRTFNLAGVQALAVVSMPYAWGSFSGTVVATDTSVTRAGPGDARAKLSVNLIGSPAMSPREFAGAPPRSVVAGVSLTVSAPTGQNYSNKLINIGTNRWAFKPEVGFSHPIDRWTIDLAGGIWLFTANDRFYQGDSTRTQDPLYVFQAHASYNVTRRAWAAVDATWYGGADVRVDGGPPSARQNNARLGATLALPFGARQSLKLAYSTGASTRTGADFTTMAVAWQYLWFDRTSPTRHQ
jgi:hypothetical protein